MVSPKITLVAASLLLSLAGVAAAHHSGAAYDMEHPRDIQGTVKTVNWTNPHITFVIETDAKDDQPAQTLTFEVSSPGVLTRSGWTKRSLQPAIMRCSTMRRCAMAVRAAFLVRVTLPSGQELSFSLTPADQ
jgi:hypothetical protein